MANIRKSFNFRTGLQVDNDNFVVNANGLVGIGTSIPQNYLLNVHGDSRVTGLTTSGTLYAGIGTIGVLSATSADVSGNLTVGSINVAGSGALTDLVGYGYTAWITDNGGVGLHTTSKIGVNTTTSPGASDSYFTVRGDASIKDNLTVTEGDLILTSGDIDASSGIVTALSFDGDLNATDLTSGTVNNSRLPSNINVSGVVTATTFVGALTGTATTATSLTGSPNITVTDISASDISASDISASDISASNITLTGIVTASDVNVSGIVTASDVSVTGIVTATTELNVGSDGTALTALSTGRLGIGTALPTSELQIRKTSGSLVEVVSDSGQARISVGNSVGAGNSSAVLRFGNSAGVLDIVNNDVGDIKNIIHNGTGIGSTGNFKWVYGQTNAERMTLTWDGKLGINQTVPTNTLHVVGTSTVTEDSWIGGNLSVAEDLSVAGNISGNITLGPILTNTNLNNTSGITTLRQLNVTYDVGFDNALAVRLGNAVAIGTDSVSTNYGLVVEQGLRADRIEVQSSGGINANAGIVTASEFVASGGFRMQGISTAVEIFYASSPDRVVFNVVGIGSTSLTLI